jgi:CTP:molybdopterin cytidylyltransferase MocA
MMVSNLDPTLRWLSSSEKYARSLHVLQLASNDLQQCITSHSQVATEDARRLVTTAQTELATGPPKQPSNGMAESILALAESIWHDRPNVCSTGTAPDEEALHLIMEKLAK